MSQFHFVFLFSCILALVALGHASSVCTDFNIANYPPQIICPASQSLFTSSNPGSCAQQASWSMPYRVNPFTSTGIDPVSWGRYGSGGPIGDWGYCYLPGGPGDGPGVGGCDTSRVFTVYPGGRHPAWGCCDAAMNYANWMTAGDDPTANYYYTIYKTLNANIWDFSGVTVLSEGGVDNVFNFLRCGGSIVADPDQHVFNVGMTSYTSVSIGNCPAFGLGSGTFFLEWVYLNTGGPEGIIVNSFGNPRLKVVGYTDSCGAINSLNLASSPTTGLGPGSFYSVGTTSLTYTVRDADGNTASCTFSVTVTDNTLPTVSCTPSTVALIGNTATIGFGTVATASDPCGINMATASVSPSSFTCANVGANTVTASVRDNNGNLNSCTTTVTIQDNTPPSITCAGAFTRNLDSSGQATLLVSDILTSSSDNCGISSTSISPSNFNCANAGQTIIVTATVVDVNSRTSTCTTQVTIADVTNPVINCRAPYTLNLNNAGTASLVFSDIVSSATDACGIRSTSPASQSFTCANIGPNSITASATDNNSRTSTCNIVVTIADNIGASISCSAATVTLNSAGQGSIGFGTVASASDNCVVASTSLSQSTFGCSDLGVKNIVASARDNFNPAATCTAQVTVRDTQTPTAVCKAASYILDSTTWTVTVAASDIDGGSTDNCPISRSVSPSTFTLADVLSGASLSSVLTVRDSTGNSAQCTASISIQLPAANFLTVKYNVYMYVPFVVKWPVLNFYPIGTTMSVKLVHVSDGSNLQIFNGLYSRGELSAAPYNLKPGNFNLIVKIGSGNTFVGAQVNLSLYGQ